MEFHPPPELWRYLSLFFLLLFSMFFSSGETAFIACNVLSLRRFSKKKKGAKRALEILKEKNKFIVTSLIGNSVVNILVGVIITSLTLEYSSKNVASIAALIATTLVLIFGEILPKSVALVFPESIAMSYSFLEMLLIKCFLPFSTIFLRFTSFFLRIFKLEVGFNSYLVSENDLKAFFEYSSSSGILEKDEKDIMNKILKYDRTTVKAIMVPRTKIVAFKNDSSINEVLKVAKNSSLSRFPIYENDIDNIIGILYIKDFIFSKEYAIYMGENTSYMRENNPLTPALSTKEKKNVIAFKNLLREPIFIFENTHLSKARATLKEKEQNLGIIMDEYGGTLGLVTIEDLNEEIFGDIIDEYDVEKYNEKKDGKTSFNEKTKDGVSLDGSSLLSQINEEFNLKLNSKRAQSIAGLIMEHLQSVPQVGQHIELDDMVFIVEKVNANKIESVLMKEKI